MNNEVLKAMKTRRSIRKYKPEQITDEQLDAILEAGTYAATGMGKQSPVIVVVQKPELIAKLSKMNAAVMGSSNDPFYGAPTVLIVLADPEIGTYHEDGSLVMGNLMLAAHAVGVDSCWIHRAKDFRFQRTYANSNASTTIRSNNTILLFIRIPPRLILIILCGFFP